MVIRGVVFDMDDTLYLERDYVRSGFAAIARDARPVRRRERPASTRGSGRPSAGVRGDTFDRLRDAFPEVASRRSTAGLVDVYGHTRRRSPSRTGPARRSTAWRPSACGWAS